MAVPTLTTDYSSIHTFESETNVSGWGNNTGKWDLSEDVELEGTYCYAMQPNATGDSGMGVTGLGGINLSTNRLYMWVWIINDQFVNTISNKGIYVRICSSTSSWTAEYNDYVVGGSDVAWCGRGWHLIAVDCTRTADASSGTTTLTNINRVGIGFNVNNTASKSDVIAIDQWWYGTYVEATGVTSSSSTHNFNDNGGSADTITRSSGDFTADGFESGDTIRVSGTTYNDGEYTVVTAAALTLTLSSGDLAQTETGVTSNVDGGITLESIFTEDGPTQDYWYGIVSKDRNGNYEINGKLVIGDQSGTNRTFFVSRGESIIIADQILSETTAEQGIFAAEDTSAVTQIVFGYSTGTGDSRVGYGGSVVRQVIEFSSTTTDGVALGTLNMSVATDTMEMFGTTFLDVAGGVSFANDTSHYVTNCAFSDCGQVDLYAAECRNLEFSNYSGGASTGALLWRTSVTDCEQSRFLACTRAIEHTDDNADIDYTNLTFYANTYDIDYSDGSAGDLVINNLGTSNANTYVISGSGTSVSIYTTKSITIHVQNEAGTSIQNAQVLVYRTTDDVYTSHASSNAQGDLDFVVQESIQADTPPSGWIRVLQDITGGKKEQLYRYASWDTSTFTLPTKITGDADGSSGSPTQLVDTDGGFLSANIEVGDTVRNETDGSWAIVLDIESNTSIRTTALYGGTGNTWDDQDTYSFHSLAVAYDGSDLVYNPLVNEQTDASGNAGISNYNYQATPEPITIRVRKADPDDPPQYKPNRSVGSISGNFASTVIMIEDPNFGLD